MNFKIKSIFSILFLFNAFIICADINEELQLACIIGDIKKVETLISQDADIESRNQSGLTPLLIACGTGNKELAEFLLGKGADINATEYNLDFTGLHIAYSFNHIEIVKLLLDKGINKSLIRKFGLSSKDFLNPKYNKFFRIRIQKELDWQEAKDQAYEINRLAKKKKDDFIKYRTTLFYIIAAISGINFLIHKFLR